MKEAVLYHRESDKIGCDLCCHRCLISDGKRGICRVREMRDGKLYSLVYGKAIAANPDPIEKKPLFHYKPGTDSFSIATIGCNFRCNFCQNWDISQRSKNGLDIAGKDMLPEEIVESAIRTSCKSIAYTYTEPTIFFEYAEDTAMIAEKKGLGNVFVTNGFMTPECLDHAKWLNAANVDLKSFNDEFYKKVCGARLEPVLKSLRGMVKRGIWVEITTLVVPTENDSPDELTQIAGFIKDELGDFVPWHVSRFHPDYKLGDLASTPIETIRKARDIGLEIGLKYVYAGNIPHENAENTYCPDCGTLLIERVGYNVVNNNIIRGKCSKCSAVIEGVDL